MKLVLLGIRRKGLFFLVLAALLLLLLQEFVSLFLELRFQTDEAIVDQSVGAFVPGNAEATTELDFEVVVRKRPRRDRTVADNLAIAGTRARP